MSEKMIENENKRWNQNTRGQQAIWLLCCKTLIVKAIVSTARQDSGSDKTYIEQGDKKHGPGIHGLCWQFSLDCAAQGW